MEPTDGACLGWFGSCPRGLMGENKTYQSRWATACQDEASREVAMPMKRELYLEVPSSGVSQKVNMTYTKL